MEKSRILFVDDEINLLKSIKAMFRKQYSVDIAEGPEKGIKMIKNGNKYAVIISDLKMPGMDGIEFLHRVQKITPDTTRIMLTGHADVEAATLAVNRGHVFRFLTKPVQAEEMRRILDAAIKQYSLVTSEKELLRGTLRGCIRVLTDVLSVVSPETFSLSQRIKRLAVKTAERLGIRNTNQLELAAMLSQLGCISLSESTLHKIHSGEELTEIEQKEFESHPSISVKLLSNIPRLDQVIEIISKQNKSAEDFPDMPFESKIIKACLDFETFRSKGFDSSTAFSEMKKNIEWYDKDIIESLESAATIESHYEQEMLPVSRLKPGMIMNQNLSTPTGVLIIAKGQEIGDAILARLNNIARNNKLSDQINVLISKKTFKKN
ncbi:HD domain-containing phosphohydrolase [Maridesulfovibrio ferrireducens]|uniref:HD domain-containing phosphohydrolase n=1 Tax=Maridesulfovibrio ferrireducens TaxID=246191 RepID=UPI001A18705D|nr:HD domain-containing phosphohydrolase [Maridesulfovibrio ferrireducens]MBI9113064.1 response regulator [Maridesulfovibrio ferrireducens]